MPSILIAKSTLLREVNMSTSVSSSMFKKLKSFLLRTKEGELTPIEAEKIQKASYALNHTEVKKRFSPVYLSFLPGLDNEDKQVFEATLYYLKRIAINKPKYKAEIVEILNEKIKDTNISPEFRASIKNSVSEIL